MAKHETAPPAAASYYRYLRRLETPGKVRVLETIETPQGTVSRLLSLNGQPVSSQENQKIEQFFDKLLQDTGLQRQRLKAQRQEEERVKRLIAALPDAFLYDLEGTEKDSGYLRLKFRPNPQFDPPSREARIYQGMTGMLWIEPRGERMAKIEGRLFKDVEFGWGILGKLHQGGYLLMEQGQAADGSWQTKAVKLQISGRIFFFKTFVLDQRQSVYDFQKIPPLTLAQAVERLRQKDRLAENKAR